MREIPALTRAKIAKVIPLLMSDKDGEVLATVAAIKRILQEAVAPGEEALSIHEFAAAFAGNEVIPPYAVKYDALARALLEQELEEHESRFARQVIRALDANPDWRMTDKQMRWFSWLVSEYGVLETEAAA